MNVIAHDPYPNEVIAGMGIPYVSLPELFARSDVITLHCPLTPDTCRLIDDEAISQMQRKPMLINTSRGTIENLDRLEAGEPTGTEVTAELVG